jgi:hypothetical protein
MATSESARSRSAWASRTISRDGLELWLLSRQPSRECTGGAAATLEQAKADFEKAWAVFLSNRTEVDFQEWRDQQDWAAEKYRRFDRGERMPSDLGREKAAR